MSSEPTPPGPEAEPELRAIPEAGAMPELGDPEEALRVGPEPREAPSAVEPVAVYLFWAVLCAGAGSYALQAPLRGFAELLGTSFPAWSQVFAAGALLCLGLAGIERARLDRKAVVTGLGLAVAALTALAMNAEWLSDVPATRGWLGLAIAGALGLLQLLVFDDWIGQRAGPRFTQLALGLRDLATWRSWVWVSRRALAMRARRQEWARRVREQRERDWLKRKAAEDLAEQRAAEHRAERERIAAAEEAARAAQAERQLADEKRELDEARTRATEAELERARVEERLERARAATLERKREAEAAVLERTRLRGDQLEANTRLAEAAAAARAAAESELSSGYDAERARALLRSAQEALAQLECDAESRRATG